MAILVYPEISVKHVLLVLRIYFIAIWILTTILYWIAGISRHRFGDTWKGDPFQFEMDIARIKLRILDSVASPPTLDTSNQVLRQQYTV